MVRRTSYNRIDAVLSSFVKACNRFVQKIVGVVELTIKSA